MKIYFGPYRKWFGPYQLTDLFLFWLPDEKRADIAEKIPVGPFEWFDKHFKKRKIKVRIDRYDTWSMDSTLAQIIYPMLIQLRADKHGGPVTDDADVPDDLKSTSAPPKEYEWDTDENFFKRWDWILEQMIWSFEEMLNDERENQFFQNGGFDKEGYDTYQTKIDNGTRLFGKYFRNLWD